MVGGGCVERGAMRQSDMTEPRGGPRPGLLRGRGQTTLEYATVLIAVAAALVTMQVYVKRGISGRLRAAADSTGEPYDPRNTESRLTLASGSDTVTRSITITELRLHEMGQGRECVDLATGETVPRGSSPATCAFCPGPTLEDCDLNGDRTCTCLGTACPPERRSDRLFGTMVAECVVDSRTSRAGHETVGPLSSSVWE